MGHGVKDETREKLRQCNLGKKASAEAREKMSKSRTGKNRGPYKEGTGKNISDAKSGTTLYNNGEISAYFREHPGPGWVTGPLHESKTTGRRWYNNGTDSIFVFDPPDNTWLPGRPFKKRKPRKIKSTDYVVVLLTGEVAHRLPSDTLAQVDQSPGAYDERQPQCFLADPRSIHLQDDSHTTH